ncbi:MAG TPA: right-handed parallel beta-helix repeat-containing protein, partial [Candidatus Bilamarchaeaceae archaeon]|nr:right-handed parallel beta-helix repeat-containing protein [Candidatus Bilamarchaeaceae archaeon]
IDCAGHNITGNESGSSYGIWINPYLKNITIKNCNGISNYSTGIHFYTDINDSLITNNTFFNLGMGIFLNPGCHNNVIANNYFHNNGAGIQIAYPTVMDNLIANNTAFDNTNHGFSFSGSNNTYINNSAIQNGYSGFFLTSANSTYINNTANNNTFAGIYLIGSGCVNNTLSGSIASFNGVGVYFSDGAANNTFSNSTLSNNSQGIEIVSGSNGNRFIDTRIYGSTSYGVSFNHTTFNNNLTNTFIYGQADYINQQATAPGPNNFFNLTLGYNSTIGLVNYPFLNVTDAVLDTNFFLLQPDWVSLDDANVPQANVSATVTLNTSDCSYVVFKKSGFPSSFGDIVANGNVCPTTLSCAGGVATFSVASFSGYAMGPSPTGCVNLSDPSTWAGRVANDTATGTLMVNANITLCRGNYYLDSVSNPALEMNASGIYLDCNGSTLDAASPGFGMAIFSTGKENLTIENCTILYYQNGIHLDQTNSSRIAFNTIIGTGRGIGLFYDSNRNQALNNTILNSTSYGIEVSASGQNLLHNNTVDTAFAQAVIITYSNGTRFLDNNVSNSSWECLWLADLSYAEVSGNNILDCGRWGNLLVARVNGSNFTGNVMRNNTGVGWIVYVGQSAGNLFEGNGLSVGYDGFNSDSSEGNTFRSNL